MEDDKEYCCPECGSMDVVVVVEQLRYVNTGGHYCYRTLPREACAEVQCTFCDWMGIYRELKECCDDS